MPRDGGSFVNRMDQHIKAKFSLMSPPKSCLFFGLAWSNGIQWPVNKESMARDVGTSGSNLLL